MRDPRATPQLTLPETVTWRRKEITADMQEELLTPRTAAPGFPHPPIVNYAPALRARPPAAARFRKGSRSATSAFHARATTATIRAYLINFPARLARSARRLTLHMPKQWPWEPGLGQPPHCDPPATPIPHAA